MKRRLVYTDAYPVERLETETKQCKLGDQFRRRVYQRYEVLADFTGDLF